MGFIGILSEIRFPMGYALGDMPLPMGLCMGKSYVPRGTSHEISDGTGKVYHHGIPIWNFLWDVLWDISWSIPMGRGVDMIL